MGNRPQASGTVAEQRTVGRGRPRGKFVKLPRGKRREIRPPREHVTVDHFHPDPRVQRSPHQIRDRFAELLAVFVVVKPLAAYFDRRSADEDLSFDFSRKREAASAFGQPSAPTRLKSRFASAECGSSTISQLFSDGVLSVAIVGAGVTLV